MKRGEDKEAAIASFNSQIALFYIIFSQTHKIRKLTSGHYYYTNGQKTYERRRNSNCNKQSKCKYLYGHYLTFEVV